MPSARCGFADIAGGASGAELLVSYGPTLFVSVGFDPNYKARAALVPNGGIPNIAAIVDTGASESCIDSLLAAQLNLPIVDQR
ncbi:MAG: hypothetical protein KIT22_08280 [Verrucomicrobiae bacterium]|nr:hypothetical protein [Verrucomicrobiae bacterium]